MFLDFELLLK